MSTASATAPDGTVGDGTTTRGRAAERWRRSRPALLVLALMVVVALGGVLALPRTTAGALDPGSAEPTGSRALAQVLGDQGVQVQRVDTVRAAAGQAGAGTTLLVVDATVLPPDRLSELAATEADLVLVEPDGPVLQALAPALAPAGVVERTSRPAACDDDHASAAGTALAGGRLVRASGPATLCFPDAEDPDAAAYAVTSAGGRTVRVLGQSAVLMNTHLAEQGNAALAMRTLGARDTLVWLMASPLDTSTDEEVAATDLLPPWVPWTGAWLVVVALLAVVWRARRLGPLVDEPLPVVVRSAETAEGRASLYRAAGARDRAAAVLRAATMRRLAARLGLPSSASADHVAGAAARASGRDAGSVRTLLLGPPPADGRALSALADDLDMLSSDALRAPTREAASS